MEIQQLDLTIRDLVAGYHDDGDDGVVGYGGKLDIRPPYQREYRYKGKQRAAVIDSILKGYPLNVMYWSLRDDGDYEIIDGQQRTISIAQYVAEKPGFSFEGLYFDNQPADIQDKILDYELMVYVCSGTDSERLAWFRIINIAGEKLTEQEMRNANFAGPWVTNAKRYFSRSGGPAYQLGGDYLSGVANKQEHLETVLKWISGDKGKGAEIEAYMGLHQHDENAKPLWAYFQSVIEWVKKTFPNEIDLPMKGENWGALYSAYKDQPLDPEEIAQEALMLDENDEVQKKSGIYRYILTREEKHLSLRSFSRAMKRKVYRKQDGVCAICKETFDISQMEADHIMPWSEGGKTVEDNCQMLCKKCNREKSAK